MVTTLNASRYYIFHFEFDSGICEMGRTAIKGRKHLSRPEIACHLNYSGEHIDLNEPGIKLKKILRIISIILVS